MQPTPRPTSIDRARFSHFLAAAVVMTGTGMLAANPALPAAADIQHRAMHLVSEADGGWSDVLNTAEQNLSALQQEMMAQPFPILTQIGSNLQDYAQLVIGMDDVPLNETGTKTITSGFRGIAEGLQAMINGSDKAPGIQELLQIMTTDLQNGDSLGAFNEFNLWSLYSEEGLLKPLVPMVTIPQRVLENFTSVLGQMVGPESLWDFGKAISKAASSPFIGLGYEFSTISGEVNAALAAGDTEGAFTALSNAPAQLAGALLNGYQVPDTSNVFVGLLNSGSLFEGLLVTWPQQIADALTVGTADLPLDDLLALL